MIVCNRRRVGRGSALAAPPVASSLDQTDGLARAVVADDDGERRVELHHREVVVVERAAGARTRVRTGLQVQLQQLVEECSHATDRELVEGRHLREGAGRQRLKLGKLHAGGGLAVAPLSRVQSNSPSSYTGRGCGAVEE